MPTIIHFNVPADDLERAKNFYMDLFGWKIEKAPGPMEYYNIDTSKNNEGGEGIKGGMGKKQKPGDMITNYIDVDNIDEYLKRVENFGGKILTPKMPVPGYGYLANCEDAEGNAFGLWQEDKSAK